MADDTQDDPSQQYEKHIQAAAQAYGMHHNILRSIGDVESGWGTVPGKEGTTGTGIVGEDGHGRGLMQIDDRSNPLSNWEDPKTNTMVGARILRQGYDYLKQNGVPEEQLMRASIAAYNHGGPTVLKNFKNGDPLDLNTQGENNHYSERVLEKVRQRDPTLHASIVGNPDNSTPPKDDDADAPTATAVSSPKVAAATTESAPSTAAETRWGKVQNFDGKTLTTVKDGKTLAYDMTDPNVRKTLAASYGIPLPEDAKKDQPQGIGGMIRSGLNTVAGYENAALSGYADSGDHPLLTGFLNKYAPNRVISSAEHPSIYSLGGGVEGALTSTSPLSNAMGGLPGFMDGSDAADARNSITGKDVTPVSPSSVDTGAPAPSSAGGPTGSPDLPPPPNSLLDGVAASDAANDAAKQATGDITKAQTDQTNQIAREMETQANMSQDSIRTTQDHYAQLQRAEGQRFDGLMSAAKELHDQAKVDPNRLFASMSTGQRILGAVGMALSQVGGAIAGQKPVDLISEAIDRAVKAQEMSFRNLQHSYNATDNAYGALIKKGATAVEAGHILHALGLEQGKQQIQAIVAGSSSPIVQAQGAKAIADLEQAQIGRVQALKQSNSALASQEIQRQSDQIAQQRALYGTPNADASGKISVQGQEFNLGPKAERVAQPLRQHLSAAEQVMSDLEELKKLEAQTGSSYSASDANKKIQLLKQSIIANNNLALGKPGNGNGQRDPKKDPLWTQLEPSHWKGSGSYGSLLDAKKAEVVKSLDNHFATIPGLPRYSDVIKQKNPSLQAGNFTPRGK